MFDIIESLPVPVRTAVLKAAGVLTGALVDVSVEAGATSAFSLLARGERREVTRVFAAAIATTLQSYPELEEIGFHPVQGTCRFICFR